MLTLVKTISTEIRSLQRIVKILRYGKSDVRTADQGAPHGIDSNPVKDLIAIYAETGTKGEKVVIGYLNKNQLAAVGETRLFSTNEDGEPVATIWLKNDGTIEVGGDTDHMVRHSKLKEVVEELQQDIGNLKEAFSSWVVASGDGGAALKASAASWAGASLSKNIDNAKINEIKTL